MSIERNFKTRELVKYQMAFSKTTEKAVLKDQNLRKRKNQVGNKVERN